MWILIFISLVIFHTSLSTLSGENVCKEKEVYKINVTHYIIRNVTVRSYVWCYRFPPRCTTFSVKQLNGTEIREEDDIRYNSVCCSGYEPDKDGNICIPTSICTINCIHGICDTESKCYCNPGYRGDDCSKECISNRWGRYCRYHCNCIRGTCNPATGHCSCPAGWSGISCNDTCSNGTFGMNCTSSCNCQSNECNPIDGQCIYNPSNQNAKHKNTSNVDNGIRRLVEDATRKVQRNDSARTAVLQKYHTFNIKVINNTDTKTTDYKSSTTEPTIQINKNTSYHKSVTTITKIVSTQGTTEYPSIYWKAHNNFTLTLEKVSTSTDNSNVFPDNVTEGVPKLLRMKILKSYEEDDSMTSLNDMQPHEEAYLDDEEMNSKKSSHTGSLFFTIGAIAGLSLLLIGVLSLVLAIRRYKRITPTDNAEDDKLEDVPKTVNGTKILVTTRSIFHTPLPDPPVINNPVFTTPIENSTIFETHVICSVNSCRDSQDKPELFYDHPPSVRTYRTDSLPEPPEKEGSHPLGNGTSTGNGISTGTSEPVYDEIPCSKPSETDSNQIYQNDNVGIYINSMNRKANQWK